MRYVALAVLIFTTLAAAASAAENKLKFMDTFTDSERAATYVEGKTYTVPQDFVDGQWEGIIAASDGKTYFGFSSHGPKTSGQFYSYDPRTDKVTHIIDVAAWCGEKEDIGKFNTQGKIHSQIFEADGKLYCATTSAHMTPVKPYAGGHFLSYDLRTGECKDLGLYADNGGGLLTMTYEPVRKRLYAISQTDQTLVYYDLAAGKIVKVGSCENNPHQCRQLISDNLGNVYGSTFGGGIYKYDPNTNKIVTLAATVPFDPNAPQPTPLSTEPNQKFESSKTSWYCTHWVAMVRDEKTSAWYGVRGNDEYLFKLQLPADGSDNLKLEGLAQFGYRPSSVQPRFASLGMCILGRKIYYCSYPMWRPMAHLMSYDIDKGQVTDHGPIVCEGGRRVSEIHSLVAGSDGTLHAAAMVWSIEGKDPANPWADRAGCYFHSRFMKIDPKTSFKNQPK